MENIDDLMRQKFDSDDPGERFEFQEEYWEQAKILLEQEEARRRRWLWLLIGLLLAFALGTWLLLGPSGILSQKADMGENSTTAIDSKEKKDKQPDFIGKSGTETQKQETSITSGDATSGTGQAKAQSAQPTPSETPGHGLGATKEQRNTEGNLYGKNAKGSAGELASDAQITGSDEVNPHRNRNRVTKKTGNAGKNLSEATLNRKETAPTQYPANAPASNDSNQSGSTTIQDKNTQETTTPPTTTPPTTTPPITNTPITNTPNIPILNLPTPLAPLPLPERTIKPRQGSKVERQPIASNKKTAESQRLTLGISLAGAAYQRSDTASAWAGWSLGGYGTYRLNKRISLMLGAQYRFVPGYGAPSDDSNPVEVTQLRYSFGYKSEVWKRETRGLHFLEIPLSAQWNKGRWGAEGGLSAGVLLAVQNQTEHTEASSLEAPITTVKKHVKGNATPYNASYFSAFVGGEYRLYDWLSVTTRLQYRFTPALKKAADGHKNSGIGNVELGLRVRLF